MALFINKKHTNAPLTLILIYKVVVKLFFGGWLGWLYYAWIVSIFEGVAHGNDKTLHVTKPFTLDTLLRYFIDDY